MTALVSFERLFEVLDIVPMIEEDPDAVDIPRGNASIEFDHVDFTYPSAEEVSLASLESVAVLESGQRGEVLHDVSFTVEPGHMVAWWARRVRARRRSIRAGRLGRLRALGRRQLLRNPLTPLDLNWGGQPHGILTSRHCCRTPLKGDAMSYARQLLDTYPRALTVDAGLLAATIDALSDCAQACTADTDADLNEEQPCRDGHVHPAVPGLHRYLRRHPRGDQPPGRV